MPRIPEKRSPFPAAARIIFTSAAVAALFSRFFHHGLLLGFFQDDFFYYLKIADNLALHGISSFDGAHLTNGYHPLWLLTLAALRLGLHGTAFFVALQTLTLASALAFYAGAERVLTDLSVHPPLRALGAFIVSMQALLLLRYGMEVTLALPLGIWLIALLLRANADTSPRRIFSIALVASLVILSRLDSILLVATLFLLTLPRLRSVRSPLRLLALLAGLSPVALYLAVNRIVFGLFTPVSGHAKQLKTTLLPSRSTVLSLVYPIDRMKLIFVLPCLLLLAAGLVAATRRLRRHPAPQRAILLSLLLFPILQITLLSVLSDWTLWPWYLYSFVFSSVAAIVLLVHPPLAAAPAAELHPLALAGSALAAAYLVYIAAYSVLMPNSIGIYTSSLQVAHFMDTHPGTYAMGDQAGMTAYLSTQPLIQLEGLVMDADFLHKLQHREPLRQILADYSINYYVTVTAQTPHPCLSLREPSQAGPHSPASLGTVCSAPLATFHRDNFPIYIFNAQTIR